MSIIQSGVDHAERYSQFALLGREAFLASVAPAALVRARPSDERARNRASSELRNLPADDTLLARLDTSSGDDDSASGRFEIYPLAKKLNAPFADMITIGRTDNNDVVLRDVTVSRFHAFFRQHPNLWIICDAGSKNGTFVDEKRLDARKEHEVRSGSAVRIGEIATTFYTANDLYTMLRPDDE